jgi:hypothetical protein
MEQFQEAGITSYLSSANLNKQPRGFDGYYGKRASLVEVLWSVLEERFPLKPK